MFVLTNRSRALLICFALILITFAVYWPVRHFGFVFDDAYFITDNRLVQAGLSNEGIKWAFTTSLTDLPLAWLSHMLDCELFGMNAGAHHLVGLFFHVGNSVLLFLLLRRATGSFWRSALVAALFAWHPLHVESVAWVAERKDMLSTMFLLLTLFAYIQYAERKRFWSYLLALILYVLGLLSKPMIVTLPFLLLLMDFWPLRRMRLPGRDEIPGKDSSVRSRAPNSRLRSARPSLPDPNVVEPVSWPRLLLEKLPFFAVAMLSVLGTLFHPKIVQEISSMETIALSLRLQNALISYIRYLGKMFWPSDLAALYPYPKSWPLWMVVGAFVFLMGLTYYAVRSAKRHPYLPLGWFWYLGTLVPVIGLIQVGRQSIADRYTYIPLIGVFIVIAWSWERTTRSWRWRTPNGVLAAAVLIGCVLTTRSQIYHWENSEKLFSHAISVTKDNDVPHNNLGIEYFKQGKRDLARTHYLEAIRANPNNFNAHNNLGIDYAELGKTEDAIVHYKEALRISPDNPEAHNNIGNALRKVGRLEESVRHLQRALAVKPDYAEAHLNLGNAFDSLGRLDDAIARYFKVIQVDPNNSKAYNNLGNTLSKQDRLVEAVGYYEKALRLDPKNQFSHNNYGHVLERQGKLSEAAERYSEALRLQPNYPEALNNLGNALQKQGKNEEAISRYREAIKVRPEYVEAHFNLGSLFYLKRDYDEAEKEYRLALQGNPNYVDARINLGNIFYLRGKFEEAKVQYQESLKSAPENLMAFNNLGNALEKLGKLDDARMQYEEVLKRNPNQPEGHNNLGYVLARLGKHKDAIGYYRQALKLNPGYVEARKNLDAAQELLRQRGETIPAETSANDARPTNPNLQPQDRK